MQNDRRLQFSNIFLYSEKQEKNTILLKNAEISQNEERLKQELRNESNEMSELYETIQSVQTSLQAKTFEAQRLNEQRLEIEQKLNDYQSEIERIEDLKNEINDKNKVSELFLSMHDCIHDICDYETKMFDFVICRQSKC